LPPGKAPGAKLRLKDFKKMDTVRKEVCAGCGRKAYLFYIEKLGSTIII